MCKVTQSRLIKVRCDLKVTDHCASSPCKHGGICTSCSTTFSCQCVDGYEGNTCEVTDHCVSSPCQHGGNCTSGSTTYSCQCADGYKGNKCEVIDHCASSPCNHGGNCTSGETTFSCQCADGYKGSKCEDTDYCASSPCQNGGNCTSGQTTFVCKCKDGFVGYTCDVKSCMEILQSNISLVGQDGIYQISVGGHERKVYCDMTTDGGGWTAIQRRQDGSTDFNQTWDNYKNGFGEPPKDYWIGNDIINILTNTDNYELRVDITSFVDKTAYALYSTFRIGNESSKYIITVSGYTGTAGDGLRNKSGKLFSTYDHDNDRDDNRNCGAENYGGWWYSYCITSNLNGKFANRLQFGYHYAVWTPWTQNVAMPYRDDAALKKTMMMIRPKLRK
ncbi:ficolin-3-like [Ostrea edulis]|uniref:ficolin-3-like n=1 Tax=Ostrea edulis TaxID=37623 RepID=UPI0024AF523E|nr:ficolin-3-like [Ostrea edulis]